MRVVDQCARIVIHIGANGWNLTCTTPGRPSMKVSRTITLKAGRSGVEGTAGGLSKKGPSRPYVKVSGGPITKDPGRPTLDTTRVEGRGAGGRRGGGGT
jgi:hypothetical protein